MNFSIILGLLQNTAILLAFGMLYDSMWARDEDSKGYLSKIVTGIIIGGFGLILILTPWTLVPGLVFDTRSVILSISGLFFGPIPTVIAMIITGIYRHIIGGPGVWMGLAVIISSGLIGILWRTFRPSWKQKNIVAELLILGLVVHLAMLCCSFLLPSEIILSTISTIAFPLLVIYPAATLLLGVLMIKRARNWQTRKALALSEERWNFALEGARDGVWDWNPETSEIFYSTQWKGMLGYEDHEIENTLEVWEQRLHPEDKERVNADLNRHLRGETELYTCIYRLRCKDGSFKWILDRGKIMQCNSKGEPIRFIGTHTDITAQKLVEAELSQAKEKAEESDRLKMSFLNNISHEVRTPLNAIMGFSNLLSEDLPDHEKERFIRIINTNAEQLLGIINDVLEFSRLESEKIVSDNVPFSVADLFDDLYHTMKPLADEKKLQLSLLPLGKEASELYLGDRNKIRQVLCSFLSNAIKYTPEGRIDLGCGVYDQGLTLFVRDTGIGIKPSEQHKIFTRFYRSDQAQLMAARGTGLGLSISKHLVEIMGGTIGVRANEPRGSEFFIRLPLTLMNINPKGKGPANPRASNLNEYTILVAEDENANYEFLNVILSRQVKRVVRALNGKEVVEIVEQINPDLILMDLKMPVMDGYEATRQVKKIRPDLPVIALTAFSQPEEKASAMEAGCNFFVSKPVQKEILFELIQKAVRNK